MDECLLLLPANPPFMLNVPPSKLSTSSAQATLAKPLSAIGSSTLQLSSSRVKLSSHIVCDSDDYLDRDIDEIADAMAIESKPSTSGATQPTLSDMMDLLQQILPCLHQILHYLNCIEQDIKEIKEHQELGVDNLVMYLCSL